MSAEVREPSAKYLVQTDYRTSDIGPIPRDWTLSTVGDEFNVQLGKMLDADRNVGIEKPYLGNRAVQWGRIDVSDVQNIRMTKADLEKFRLQRGDLLVCEGGEVGRAAIWNAEITECYYQKALHRLRPLRGYEPSLMLALLQLYASRGVLSNYVTQTSIAHLPKEKFVAITIPRPEPEEQRAIAAALSDVDALISGLEKLIAKKRDLKQAAIQQLLTGQTRLPGFSGDWVHKQLGDVIREISDGGTPSTSDSRNFGGDVPWVVIDDIQQKIANTRTMLTEKGLQACAARRWPQGTLIVSTGATIGEVGILHVSAATKQGICGIIFDPLLARPEYMQYWFVKNKKLLLSKAQGSSIKEIRAPTLVTLPVSIPGIDEQAAIAGVLNDMDVDIAIYQSRLAKTCELKQGMMQELLTGRTRLV